MSTSQSLMTFQSNEKQQPQVQANKPVNQPQPHIRASCFRAHFNSLWSVWYGLCTAGLQAYIAEQSAQRFLGYAALTWPGSTQPPHLELHAYLALNGVAVLLIPFFLAAALFKIGNLANDGFKLGRHLSTCAADPASSVVLGRAGVLRSLWQHGGPTAPFLHLVTSFCLLLPKLLVEARLIETGLLHKDAIWQTDLDFMVVHQDRLVVLSFMTSLNHTNFLPTPLPFLTSSVHIPPSNLMNVTEDVTLASSVSTAKNQALRSHQELVSSNMEAQEWATSKGPVSAEFLNYALALLVYAVRYPAVFWNTNKGFAALFSLQLLANGLQSLLAFAGVSVLYKVQVVGAAKSLPLLRTPQPFLLNAHVTLALFVLSNVLVLASSLVLYLYGYGRFNSFLRTEQERRVVVLSGAGGTNWGYFTHCAALCVLLALAVCNAPLLFDYTIVYRGSLDGAILATAVGAILHLFLWILLWLLLTLKQRWNFKLRVTVGRATVRSARSVKLVTDVDLVSAHHDALEAPLLVVGNGRTYTITDISPKKAIMSVIQRAALECKTKGNGQVRTCDDSEEQIYWLRPKSPSPKTSPETSDQLNWLNRKLSGKHKVTFDDSTSTRKNKSLLTKSGGSKGNKSLDQLTESEEDDGDYATLREIPSDSVSEENKLLDSALRDDSITYARTNRDLTPGDYEDPSPLLTPEPPHDDLPLPQTPCDNLPAAPVAVMVHSSTADSQQPVTTTPRCLRRADSGMPHDELTPRSDSDSSGGSPPSHSETSSGVHSNSSSETHKPRSTSVDDLTVESSQQSSPAWRSFSLQRNAVPSPPPQVVESTVVIRRSKQARPKTTDEPFGRSTNMRMTSFTDHPAATLPLYPTQQVATVYPHCSTMPLPTGGPTIPRQHTTIPSHVRLFNPFMKRLHHCGSGVVPNAGLSGGHHTFPHKYTPLQHKQDRDSANFSMASSGDSDQCLPHT